MNAEKARLTENQNARSHWVAPWRLWGPYVSERQWGTVREDYSPSGDAWSYFPFEQAHSRVYRWGEDAIAGVCDQEQYLCLAPFFWNGRDPILKERLFGLSNPQGNHGEDVKEIYYHLDAVPSHAYLKFLYKYPQAEFPYAQLREGNRRRGRMDREYELLDTGIFADDRYFDVFIEYAKASPTDILLRVEAINRGREAARLVIGGQLWFRNTWAWRPDSIRPRLTLTSQAVRVTHHELGPYSFTAEPGVEWLFTENETNAPKLYGVKKSGHFKDAFHDYLIRNRSDAVNAGLTGTKCAAVRSFLIPPGESVNFQVRLCQGESAGDFTNADALFAQRRAEADEFYADLQKDVTSEDARRVQRQAWANLVWNRQFYHIDIPQWLRGDPTQPPPPWQRRMGRNRDWEHLNNADVLTMPDKWEYPYYCVWDSAFQCVAIAMIDPQWAKYELILLLREWYMHPNGQIPAYEWNFNDVNPPVHAWATWRIYRMEGGGKGGAGDLDFLERVFHKLMLNFTWWVNRKDAEGRNVFQGGFLGMDNIGVFDRSAPLPTGGFINQADGTAWMGMYCLNMMRIATELARHNRVYEDVATKFFEHFLHIAEAMTNMGGQGIGLWDEEDRFYYDELNLPDGSIHKLKVRSMVGFVPLFAVEVLEPELLDELPDFARRLKFFLNYRQDLAKLVSKWEVPGRGERRLLSLLRGSRMKALLRRLLDETEFLSDFGPRTMSRVYAHQPYTFRYQGMSVSVTYRPAESDSGMFGGNSNWRGPIWFPVSYLIIEALQKFHFYYDEDFRIECPTGSGNYLTIWGVADELSARLSRIFLRGPDGRRPVFGGEDKLDFDPHFRDYLIFPEYFDGDTGRGAGTLFQGWTCLVAKLLQPR